MRTANLREGRRIAGFFRLCLGIIISLTLAMGGMALNTAPVQAVFHLTPPLVNYPVPECQFQAITFTHLSDWTCLTPPYTTYFFLKGVLPPGSTWNMTTGVLTVCPPQGTNGTVYPFAVRVISMDNAGCIDWGDGWHWTKITVTPPGIVGPLVITPIAYQVGWENMPFNMTLAATGCSGVPANYNWACNGLPVGLTVNAATGQITGNPAPGTCGTHTVTVTCNDTSMCPTAGCCPPVTTTFTLFVDCWANHYAWVITYADTGCEHGVQIGPGLGQGQTQLSINGIHEATLGANGSYSVMSNPCKSQLAVVVPTVAGPNPQTRYACIGTNAQWLDEANPIARFNYVEEVYNGTGSDPTGIFTPQGAGWHQKDSYFSSTAPATIESPFQSGEKNVFKQWRGPGGVTNSNRDLVVNVTAAGDFIAGYDTFCELTLRSDSPPFEKKSWELKGSTVKWNTSLQSVPMQGICGFLGGVDRPVNTFGETVMNGPQNVEIRWAPDCTIPILIIILILLAIAAAIFFSVRNSKRRVGPDGTAVKTAAPAQPRMEAPVEAAPVKPAVSAAPEKKAPTEAEVKDKLNFCPTCGTKVPPGATFCPGCGKQL